MLWGIFLLFCALGPAQHFLFRPLGRPRSLLWLLPVNESPWEHYKLAFWPLGGALAVTAMITGLPFRAFVCAWFAGAGSILGTVLAVCVVGFTVYMLVRPNKYSENTLTVQVK